MISYPRRRCHLPDEDVWMDVPTTCTAPWQVDFLVVGAGPVGLVSAILLGRQGWRVVVIEDGPSVIPCRGPARLIMKLSASFGRWASRASMANCSSHHAANVVATRSAMTRACCSDRSIGIGPPSRAGPTRTVHRVLAAPRHLSPSVVRIRDRKRSSRPSDDDASGNATCLPRS